MIDLNNIKSAKLKNFISNIHLTKEKRKDVYNSYFDTELFLFRIYSKEISINFKNNIIIIDKLCKKIDVVKNVYKFYKKDLSQVVLKENIGKKYQQYLCFILLYLAYTNKDLKFLNSALKMIDYILDNKDKKTVYFIEYADFIINEIIE